MIMTLRWTRKCPKDCRYRNRQAAFCGYCMLEVLKNEKEDEDDSEQNETENAEQAVREEV